MTGTVPQRQSITSGNWQKPENLRWSFQHMDSLFPGAVIAASPQAAESRVRRPQSFHDVGVPLPDGTEMKVTELLARTNTDAWLVMKGREILAEEYFGQMEPGTRHLLMSVSKSLVSSVVGALTGQGVINVNRAVEHYIPVLSSSGYKGATVRNVLDMRSGVRFSESYLDPTSEVRQLDEAVGWSATKNGAACGLKAFLCEVQQERGHGGHFDYRSCETDVLGWVCEAATGRKFSDLASELLWFPLAADFDAWLSVDSAGTGIFDGGISACLTDLALFGAMIRDGGVSLRGNRILSSDWVEDIFSGGRDSDQAFAAGSYAERMPGGKYRSQFWFLSKDRDAVFCLGIHGQMVYINRRTGVVGVKLSSTPLPGGVKFSV